MRISHGPQLVQYELSRSRGLGDKPAATPGVLFLATPLPSPLPRSQIRLFLVDRKRIPGEWSMVPGALELLTNLLVIEGGESNGGTYCGIEFSVKQFKSFDFSIIY